MPIKIAVYGVFGVGNVGNDESGRVMIQLLRGRYPDAEVTALSGGSDATADLGVPVVALARSAGSRALVARLFSKLAAFPFLVRAVGSYDAVVVSGTGLLESKRRLPGGDMVWLGLLSLAGRLRRVPVSWFAIGGGWRMSLPTRVFARTALALTTYSSFRDDATPVSLRGRRATRSAVIPDLVFGRDAGDRAAIGRQRDTACIDTAVVGMAIIDYDQTDPAEYARYYETMVGAASVLIERGASITFLLGDSADHEPTSRVRGAVARRHPDVPIRVVPFGRFSDIVDAAAACDVVIASRFHVLIAAGIAACPVVAVSHAAKDDTLLAQWKLSRYCLPAPTTTGAEIVAAAETALAEAASVSETLSRSAEAFAASVRSEVDRTDFVVSHSSRRRIP